MGPPLAPEALGPLKGAPLLCVGAAFCTQLNGVVLCVRVAVLVLAKLFKHSQLQADFCVCVCCGARVCLVLRVFVAP